MIRNPTGDKPSPIAALVVAVRLHTQENRCLEGVRVLDIEIIWDAPPQANIDTFPVAVDLPTSGSGYVSKPNASGPGRRTPEFLTRPM